MFYHSDSFNPNPNLNVKENLNKFTERRIFFFTDKKGVYFIGGNDIEVENEYIWSSSRQKITYTRWASGQPDSLAHDGDDCISINYYSDYQWHDTQCDISYRFICEIKYVYFFLLVVGVRYFSRPKSLGFQGSKMASKR
jgi:nucleoside-specific outer membrane channel protein Tsx